MEGRTVDADVDKEDQPMLDHLLDDLSLRFCLRVVHRSSSIPSSRPYAWA